MSHTGIAIVNQKGGVGKTTTTINLAATFTRRGLRITVCDLDPQANASRTLGLLPPEQTTPTLYDLLLNPRVTVAHVLQESKLPGVFLISAHLKLSTVDSALREELATIPSPWTLLRDKFRADPPPGDLILLDCPPALSLLTLNALAAADYYLIPVESGAQYSLDGLDDLLNIIGTIQTKVATPLRCLGLLLTKHQDRHMVCRAMRATLQTRFGEDLLKTTIRQTTIIRQAEALRLAVPALDRRTAVAQDFEDLATELWARLQDPQER